jgi:Tol biopolymer transport system component
MITLPDRNNGLVLHDLAAGSSVRLFQEWLISDPRFSPDGSRYAFYAGENNEANLLVIQKLGGGSPARFEMEKQEQEKSRPQGRNLTWSPSGKFLAGVVFHDNANKKLYVWHADGSLMTTVPIAFQPGFNWAPLWSVDESEVILFERELMPGEKNKNVKPLTMHKVRVGK